MKILLSAYILDIFLGDPQGFPHPVRYIGNLITYLEKKILKENQSNREKLLMGAILCLTVVIVTYITTFGIVNITYSISNYLGIVVSVLLGYTTLATKSLDTETRKVYRKLQGHHIKDARLALSYIVGRDTEDLEEEEIARAAVETIGENISDGIIAPMFYFFLGGVPLAMAYKAVNTLDSMVGYKNEKYLYFGRVSAKVDDFFNYIPARLTGGLIITAAFFMKCNYRNSFKIVLRDRKNHNSPNAGYPEAAVAGALNIQLGGTNKYFGKTIYKPTIGDKVEELNAQHIIKTIRLMYGTSAVGIIVFSALKLVMEVV
ncbi:MAG: cobalamin biosynthesis protein CobD [Clostridiaceae bacterium]|nr:cobalamin biosynthesis protein CobD [Clostridiaceae bacterium]